MWAGSGEVSPAPLLWWWVGWPFAASAGTPKSSAAVAEHALAPLLAETWREVHCEARRAPERPSSLTPRAAIAKMNSLEGPKAASCASAKPKVSPHPQRCQLYSSLLVDPIEVNSVACGAMWTHRRPLRMKWGQRESRTFPPSRSGAGPNVVRKTLVRRQGRLLETDKRGKNSRIVSYCGPMALDDTAAATQHPEAENMYPPRGTSALLARCKTQSTYLPLFQRSTIHLTRHI